LQTVTLFTSVSQTTYVPSSLVTVFVVVPSWFATLTVVSPVFELWVVVVTGWPDGGVSTVTTVPFGFVVTTFTLLSGFVVVSFVVPEGRKVSTHLIVPLGCNIDLSVHVFVYLPSGCVVVVITVPLASVVVHTLPTQTVLDGAVVVVGGLGASVVLEVILAETQESATAGSELTVQLFGPLHCVAPHMHVFASASPLLGSAQAGAGLGPDTTFPLAS
jgi:hypothetical protein